ncbi:SusC/RagA family TonB-linked outer membrane protein [Winogradskyella psychrotolerans]|uniref:SusC/RagA family TonB-linked outer membrane protein n=1 Tax=Winogradskyella psychrotolerans TaxID=1344585 RepID=UPI001C06C589|nr:TonB-dependent receptor [Winogradskyella psychrotolerans]MBU2929119.1 TonB-dependent receptor [Winogradskyella psychrotolerans]
MKIKLLTLISFIFTMAVFGQNVDVTGTVTEASSGQPLPGVNVILKNTSKGASTNFDGEFTLLDVPLNSVVVVSYIGFVTQEITIVNNDPLTIALVDDAESLSEVVVIGYGTQKVTNVSGAISTVKSESIENLKPTRVEEALQGSASGVSVIQSGSPGSKPTVLVRGIPSFTGTDPVVIIDGVPQSLDDLNSINSADIQSLSILKDAASTAIYGVKGGNGVIVVTTKGGRKNEKTEFSFNTYTGFQSVDRKIGLLNASEYAAIINEGSVTSGGEIIFPNLSTLGEGTDWQDEVFKDAKLTSYSLSARGGTEKLGYFLSTGYLSQGGIVGGDDKSNFNRLNFTANIDFQLTSKLKFILNASYANIKSKTVAENSFNSILGNAINFDPTVSPYNTDPNDFATYGYSNLLLSEIFNPVQQLENTYNENNGNKLYGKFELQYDILDNLKVTSRFGYTKWDQVSKSFSPLAYYGPNNVSSDYNSDGSVKTQEVDNGDGTTSIIPSFHNSVSESTVSNFNYTFETFASYGFNLKDQHFFDVVLGISTSKSTGYGFGATRQDVRDNSWAWADVSAATGINTELNLNAYTGYSYQNLERRNVSYFSRVNYDFEGKYLASFSARRDGSIAFGDDNKFANFYAGSLGWVVSNEDFFDVDAIDFLKVRGSYGTVGNENVDPQYVSITVGGPSYNSTANSNGYTFGSEFVSGATVNSFNNTTLSWEEQTQYNIGFDTNLFNSTLSLTFDYFNKSVEGLLFTDAPPLYAGTSEPVTSNIGSTESKGIDLTLGYRNSITEDFKFNTSFTFTTSKNEVTETNSDGTAFVAGGTYFNGQSQDATRFEKGFTPGYFYGYETDGLFQNQDEIDAHATQAGALPGDIRFVDTNGDGVIDDDDKTDIGDPFPTFTIGWNLGLEYKNFDLSMFTYASVGNDIYKAYERNAQFTNKDRSILNRWTGEGSTNDANSPRYTFADTNSNIRPSDRYVEDGSFIKIKSLILGYTLPESMSTFFSKVRVYAQAKNLLTLTEYTGYDPEIAGGILDTGIDRGAYPQARTFLVGLDLKF